MYLWNVNKLVEDFKENKVTEKEKMKYLIVFGVVVTLATDPFISMGIMYSVMDVINTIAMLIMVVGGTYYCYVINRDADNRDYVSRSLCLGLPIVIRVFIFSIPLMMVIGFIEGAYSTAIEGDYAGVSTFETTGIQVIFSVLFGCVYYWYLGSKLKSFSGENNA